MFFINVILVLDEELLYVHLRDYFVYGKIEKIGLPPYNFDYIMNWIPNYEIAVEQAPKSSGCRMRDQSERAIIRRNIIRNYFYGPLNNWRPYACELSTFRARIYQIGGNETKSNLLPAQEVSAVEEFAVCPVRMDTSLRGQILAILHVDDGTETNQQSYNDLFQQHLHNKSKEEAKNSKISNENKNDDEK